MYLFEPPPFGGIEGLPHFVKFPAKTASLLTIGGTVLYLCITRRQRGETKKAARATLMRGLRMAQATDRAGSALGLNWIQSGTEGGTVRD